jgi:predicted nucleic acid-binding protein
VFVSLFAGPAHPTHEAALGLFRRVAEGMLALVLTPAIVAELVYVCTQLLGWSRATLAQWLTALLEADGLVLAEGATLATALDLYSNRPRLDFADAYLAACAIVVGPGAVASFDRDIDGIKGIRRITA